ncbi:MAG: hypothetical protein H6867_02645 [Rhodospirillales bacterium]|nr:hypothetical protein [Rhodospirillales bacterium]MCB9997087.1 hypothetical protein [Rhodospirillales bacterium]
MAISQKNSKPLLTSASLALCLSFAGAQTYAAPDNCPSGKELFNTLMQAEGHRNGNEVALDAMSIYLECSSEADSALGRRLAMAIWANNPAELQYALDHGADEEMKSIALTYAVTRNKPDMFDKVLAANPADKSRALRYAHKSHPGMFDKMIAHGLSDDETVSLFTLAQARNDRPLFDRLLAANPSSEIKGQAVNMLIYEGAVTHNLSINTGMVDSLLSSGIAPQDLREATLTALQRGEETLFNRLYTMTSPDQVERDRLFKETMSWNRASDATMQRVLRGGISEALKVEILAKELSDEPRRVNHALVNMILDSGLSPQARQDTIDALTKTEDKDYSERFLAEYLQLINKLISPATTTQPAPKQPAP